METDSYDEGVPSWIDLAGVDDAAAAAFYRGLLGWDVPDGDPAFGGYRNCSLGGRSVAGITPMPSPVPAWTTYVNLADVDATAAKATEHGGTVLFPPSDVADLGRMAVVADPAGAVIGLWQAGTMKGAGRVNETGAWGWSELVATDVEAAVSFYTEVFGWGATRNPPEGPPAYVEWTVDGRSMSGLLPRPEAMPASVPDHWIPYFMVDDADAAAARVGELGGRVMAGPMDIEPGRMVTAADPSGAAFNLLAARSS